MAKIRQGNQTQDTNPNGPQKLSTLYDNKGTKRKTNTMERIIGTIRLQNRIPPREGKRKTRRTHQKSQRHTIQRRRKSYPEAEDATTRRILPGVANRSNRN